MATDEERREIGLKIKEKLGRAGLKKGRGEDDEFADITLRVVFGDLFARPGLSLRDREMISMAVMIATGADFDRLYHHFKNAPNLGISDREIREMIYQTMFYAGWPKGAAAIRYYNRVKSGEERV
jgi:4-carboxymuconolactone decarboxylase